VGGWGNEFSQLVEHSFPVGKEENISLGFMHMKENYVLSDGNLKISTQNL
jgi:hypothetical protein